MKIGMTLPVTEPGWSRDVLKAWCNNVEQGPFDSLALGERLCFPSPEVIATLSAAAVLTERVRLHTTVLIAPIHDPVVLAKQLATIDVFSEGRLTVGVGTGGREEDYIASGTDIQRKRIVEMERAVECMREVWAGEIVREGLLRPVEPFPVQDGGPPILAGVFGPKGVASAAGFASGIAGMSMSARADEAAAANQLAQSSWQAAGRDDKPYVTSSFWFALGDTADEQIRVHLNRYFNWLDADTRNAMSEHCGFRGSAADLAERIREFEAAGCDELQLIPTSIDPDEVLRAAEAVNAFM
ncbi:MAG: LLM class flavin-dependent oxidoreductase [Pseudomonadales bacterium]